MPANRRVAAVFDRVAPVEGLDGGTTGLELGFRAASPRFEAERLEDFADLGPALTVPAVAGMGKVLRILRAARIASPRDPLHLLGDAAGATELLERALGTPLVLEVRPRSDLRFTAWTETGVQTVDHVAEVIEGDDAYLVMRRGGRFPVRVEREHVVRQRTEVERWYEVLGVERR